MTPAPAGFELERLLYVVGDIHGRHDLLVEILRRIEDDARDTRKGRAATVVFLGDYVDRGGASAQVLETLAGLEETADTELVFLMGNHERAMLDFIANPIDSAGWLGIGGMETVRSFGLPAIRPNADEAALVDCADSLNDALGARGEFLRHRLVLSAEYGNVFLCHAAVNRNHPLESQTERALLWGNESFLDRGGHPGRWFVHGHTITEKPVRVANRIGIDTGAYLTGVLTAARIDAEGCRFLQTGRG